MIAMKIVRKEIAGLGLAAMVTLAGIGIASAQGIHTSLLFAGRP